MGQPLCLDCYDHAGQVVWHHEAPELWRRTTQEVDREIRRLGRAHGVELRRRYFKVYEFQTRAAIHYHILIRLDGYNPDCPDAIAKPPACLTRLMLEAAVRAAFGKVSFTSARHPANGMSPFQGWAVIRLCAPGRCPGLLHCAPSGLGSWRGVVPGALGAGLALGLAEATITRQTTQPGLPEAVLVGLIVLFLLRPQAAVRRTA